MRSRANKDPSKELMAIRAQADELCDRLDRILALMPEVVAEVYTDDFGRAFSKMKIAHATCVRVARGTRT